MKDRSFQVPDTRIPAERDAEADPGRRSAASARHWARAAVAAQVAFTASWLLAAAWQGPRYSVFAHSISDMYAVTAPGAAFLIIVLTVCGAATTWFALRSLRPTLRSALGSASAAARRLATAGSWLLALSIFGLGDLLTITERLDCRLADPGCTAAKQVSNFGGTMDSSLSTVGLFLFVIGGFLLAAAMKRAPGWQSLVRPTRWCMALMTVIFLAEGLAQHTGLSGLFERLAALAGATWIAFLAAGVSRRSRAAG
jgi:hypothetical protein